MTRNINSAKAVGTKGIPIIVECSIDKGVGIHLIGLPDAAVKESLLRTVTALQANGYHIPGKRIIINLAPSDLRKTGTGYDLPIALAIIAASGQDNETIHELEQWMAIGELGLDGTVRDVPETLQAILATKENGCKGCIIPEGNLPSIINVLDDQVPIYPVKTLKEAISVISEPEKAITAPMWYARLLEKKPDLLNAYKFHPSEIWDSIQGNEGAKRAVEIAAAGGHPLLLMGAPGSGKSLMAKALQELLPPMTGEEANEVAAIYSLYNYDARQFTDAKRRPFRAPHHSSSISAMFGGGSGDSVRPGEVSLAHNGVLYLDEINNAPKAFLEAFRAPLENKAIKISRLKSITEYPADFHLVVATEPCPCGYYGEGDRCTCTKTQRELWLQKLSGPVYDRLTVQAWCRTPKGNERPGESFVTVYERVQKAIELQRKRFDGTTYRRNDEIMAKDVDKYCALNRQCKELLDTIIIRTNLSALAYSRIIRIARTIADLAGSDEIKIEHIAEASSYRFLDRKEI